jgi:hypothetical protein
VAKYQRWARDQTQLSSLSRRRAVRAGDAFIYAGLGVAVVLAFLPAQRAKRQPRLSLRVLATAGGLITTAAAALFVGSLLTPLDETGVAAPETGLFLVTLTGAAWVVTRFAQRRWGAVVTCGRRDST